MSNNQDLQTKDFVDKVKELENTGAVKNREEIIKAVKWNKASMSTTMTGKQNVPAYIYKRFMDIYFAQTELNKLNGSAEPNGDYKDKYIALLNEQNSFLKKQLEQRESQIATRKDYFDKLEEVNANYVKMGDSLQKMRKELTEVHALARTLYVFFQHTYSHQLKQPREKVSQDMDIVFGQVLQQQHELDSQPA